MPCQDGAVLTRLECQQGGDRGHPARGGQEARRRQRQGPLLQSRNAGGGDDVLRAGRLQRVPQGGMARVPVRADGCVHRHMRPAAVERPQSPRAGFCSVKFKN